MSQQVSDNSRGITIPKEELCGTLAGNYMVDFNPIVTEAALYLDRSKSISFHFVGRKADKSDDPMPGRWSRFWYWFLLNWKWERIR